MRLFKIALLIYRINRFKVENNITSPYLPSSPIRYSAPRHQPCFSSHFQSRFNTLAKSLAASGALYTLVALTAFVLEALKSSSGYVASAVAVPVVGIAFNLIITWSSKAFRTLELDVEERRGTLPNGMTIHGQRSDTLEIPAPSGIYPLSSMRPYALNNLGAITASVEKSIVPNDVENKEEEVKRWVV
jgi:hypothetical protein